MKNVHYSESHQLCISSSWDKHILLWDFRVATPVKSFTLSERIYAASLVQNWYMAACADKSLARLDLDTLEIGPVRNCLRVMRLRLCQIKNCLTRHEQLV